MSALQRVCCQVQGELKSRTGHISSWVFALPQGIARTPLSSKLSSVASGGNRIRLWSVSCSSGPWSISSISCLPCFQCVSWSSFTQFTLRWVNSCFVGCCTQKSQSSLSWSNSKCSFQLHLQSSHFADNIFVKWRIWPWTLRLLPKLN